MSQHGIDQFIIAETIFRQPERLVGWHVLAQQIAHRHVHGGDQRHQLVTGGGRLQIVDDCGFHAAVADQLQGVAGGTTFRVVIDGDCTHLRVSH